MHLGIFHLASNSFGQLIVGPMVQFFSGKLGFLIIYLGSGLTSSIFFNTTYDKPNIGASGAVYGVLGAYLIILFLDRDEIKEVPTLRIRIILTSLACIVKFITEVHSHYTVGLATGVGHSIHATGFVSGAALMYFWLNKSTKKISAYLVLGVIFALNVLMLVTFYTTRKPIDVAAFYPH
jgi:rhomboid protease GluP